MRSMKAWFTGIALLVLVVLIGVWTQPPVRVAPPMPDVEAAAGTEDDPGARAEFEEMRLRDPATGLIPNGIRQKELAFAARIPSRESLDGLAKFSRVAAPLVWTKRGPRNVGGRTRALALDVTTTNVILAGGVSGGIWRSTDDGANWAMATTTAQLRSITCIAQDTRSGKGTIWYAGSGEASGNSASGGAASFRGDGIYKSTDGGVTWAQLPSTVSGTPQVFDKAFDYVTNVAIDPSNLAQDEVYAAAGNTIQRSTDGGTTWTAVLGTLSLSAWSDVQVNPSGVVYAAINSSSAQGGIWRSADGVTWTNISSGVTGFPSTFSRVGIGISPSSPNVVMFLVQGTSGTNGVDQINGHQLWKYTYLSGDGSGAAGTWQNRGVNLPNLGIANDPFDSQGGYDLIVRFKPDDTSTVFVGGSSLYRSTNGFSSTATTQRIGGYNPGVTNGTYPNHHPDQHALAFLPTNPLVLYSGHDGGISKTTNDLGSPQAWTSLNNGYQVSQFYTICLDHGTPGSPSITGGTQDNGTWGTTSSSGATAWVSRFSGDGAFCDISDGETAYLVSAQSGITYRFRASDGAWTRVDPAGGTGYSFISPFAADPSDRTILYFAGGASLWLQSNLDGLGFGFSNGSPSLGWTNLTAAGIAGTTISAIGVSKTPASRVYYGSANGKIYRLDNASGATAATVPTDVWTGKGLPAGAYVSCIAVDPSNADRAMAVFSNYNTASLFMTTDGGTSWTGVEGNLGGTTGPSTRWASIVPFSGTTTYFVGASTGLYSTTVLNGASTVWAQEGASTIGNVVVDMMDYRLSDGTIVVGTHGGGVWSSVIAPTGVAEAPLPNATALYQNYPNPFNPSTTIQYQLATDARVTLTVYDVTGAAVATLVDGSVAAGPHSVVWAPWNLASGVYFYTLRAGAYGQTRSLVLLK
jgi:hypothetical protein